MKVTAISLAALLLLGATALADDFPVYMWVDSDGVPHYTDRPPNSADVTFTGIRSQRTNPDAVMARTTQRGASGAASNQASDAASKSGADPAADRRQQQEERKANCEQARERAESYNNARRLYRPTPDGGRDYLTDQELSDARAAADEAVNTWCD
jgi:catalase